MACSTAVPSLLPTHLQQVCHCDTLETTALILLTCCWHCSPLNTLTDTDANTQAHFTPTRLFNSVFTLHSTTPSHVFIANIHLYLKKCASTEAAQLCAGSSGHTFRPCAHSRGRPGGAGPRARPGLADSLPTARPSGGHARRDRERTAPAGLSRA